MLARHLGQRFVISGHPATSTELGNCGRLSSVGFSNNKVPSPAQEKFLYQVSCRHSEQLERHDQLHSKCTESQSLAIFFFKGVHMIFTGEFDERWGKGEERLSKLVFIGKHLNHDELKAGFAACLYSEDRAQQKLENLRFQIGETVEVKFSTGWREGTIQQRMFRARIPGGLGKVAPYLVRLTNGPWMLVPTDSEDFVRLA